MNRHPNSSTQCVKPTLLRAGFAFFSMVALAACGGSAAPSPAAPSISPAAPSSPAASIVGQGEASSAAGEPAASSTAARAVSGATRAPLDPVVKVRIGSTGAAAESTMFLAADRGYFKDEGLDIEFNHLSTGSDALPSLIAGQLDVGTGSPVITYFNALAREVDLKIVAFFQVTPPTSQSLVIQVRKDLIDSGRYKGPQDFRGMNFASTNPRNLWVDTALAKGGLKPGDVNIIQMGYPEMIVAFANKRIDAAMEVQPFGLQAVKQGVAQNVFIAGDLLPGTPTTMLLYGPSFIKDHSDAARRFMVAFIRAERDVHNAFELNQGDKQAIYASLAKYATIKDPQQWADVAAQGQFNGTPVNGEIDVAGLEIFQKYYRETGQQKDPIDFGKAVDRSFSTYAIEQLGRA